MECCLAIKKKTALWYPKYMDEYKKDYGELKKLCSMISYTNSSRSGKINL